MDEKPGIYITSIVPPDIGWPIAVYCSQCRTTIFMYDRLSVKPSDGDYFQLTDLWCPTVVRHNFTDFEWQQRRIWCFKEEL